MHGEARAQEQIHFERPRAVLGTAPADFRPLPVLDFAFAPDLVFTEARFFAPEPRRFFFFLAVTASTLSRAQKSVALIARCHPAINSLADSLGIAGVKRVNSLVPMNSAASFHTPPAIPARPAAPNAVVSIISGRSTGMPRMSDWNCSSQLLADAPPSTRRDSNLTRPRLAITASISADPYAIASSAALAKCARDVPRVRPRIVPRAFGSQFGAPSPTRAGTK